MGTRAATGQDPASLPPGHYYGVGVDVGAAGFLDLEALQHMAQRADQSPNALEALVGGMSIEWVDPATGTNYIIVNIGYGDGHYPVWIGRQNSGAVTCFVIDMLIARLTPNPTPSNRTETPAS